MGLAPDTGRGNAAAPWGERQRGSSQHWKRRFELVNSQLTNLLNSTVTTGGGAIGTSAGTQHGPGPAHHGVSNPKGRYI